MRKRKFARKMMKNETKIGNVERTLRRTENMKRKSVLDQIRSGSG